MDWVDISVFISSTFNDMHAERDLLLKKVFPELSEWCARRRIRLYDIDLRWGVTSEDSKSKNTVEVCLRNIDRCRPFFLCFLGQRRGWVPGRERINPETLVHYPGITDRIGKRSVTEMEIEHALLAPMLRLVEGKDQLPETSKQSLFFIRDGSYLSSLNEAQRMIFTNADTEDTKQTDLSHAEFISRVRREWNAVYDYSCCFDRDLYSAELRERGEDCARGRLTDFMVQNQPMERFILEEMKRQILAVYPERAEEFQDEGNEPEENIQERRAEDARSGTVEREEITGKLASSCKAPGKSTVFLYGKAGSGKTTLLSRFYQAHRQDWDQAILRFCGITAASSRWTELWRGILEELGIEERFETGTQESLLKALRKVAGQGKTLIVIDGIDELQEGLSALSALPGLLPDGICLVMSFRSDAADAEPLLEHLKESSTAKLCEVPLLSGEREITALIHSYLEQYLKALDDEHIKLICENPAAGNPLFLKILLRELRVFGSRSQMIGQLAAYGDTPGSAFGKLLDDLENEISYNPIPPAVFVSQMMGTLALVRGSIRLTSFRQALCLLLGRSEEDVSDTLAYYIRRLRPYLSLDGSRIGISYRSLQECAAKHRPDLTLCQHEALAKACIDAEPLESLYHHRMAEDWEAVFLRSEDLPFLFRVILQAGALSLQVELEESFRSNHTSVNTEVLECLQQTASLIERNSRVAAPVFYKELTAPRLRRQAKALCEVPWLRYEAITADPPAETESRSFRTLFTAEHMGCQGFCLAEEKNIAYLLKGEAEAAVCDLVAGAETASFPLDGSGRIRKIVCSPDGTVLAAAGEDLSLGIWRITLDSRLRLLAQSLVLTDRCASVRFGGISLFAASDGILWQRPDGTTVRWSAENGQMTEQAAVSGRLTGCFAGGTVWKEGSGYCIRLDDGNPCVTLPARINAALFRKGMLCIAAEDRMLTVIHPKTGETAARFPLPTESLVCLCVSGGEIYGADRYGTLVRCGNGGAELLGRITQGDNIVDMNTQLLPISDEKMAFVSMQRRAVLTTKTERQTMRLFRVIPGRESCAVLWDGAKDFVAEFPDKRRRSVPWPKYLLAGNNLNEKNNLKAACSGRSLVYEENGFGLRFLTPEGDYEQPESFVSEMGGLICELRYVPETETFRSTSYAAQFCEMTEQGKVVSRLDLPRSDSNLYLLCPCGERSAVLSRRVRAWENQASNAFMIDVLTMIENGRILWTLDLPRRSDQVNGLLYDRNVDRLMLFYSKNRMEELEPQTGEVLDRRTFPLVNFVHGAAVRSGIVYSVSGEGRESRLTARSLSGDMELALPSQRRVRQITEGYMGIIVQEGDEKIYCVSLEMGKITKEEL